MSLGQYTLPLYQLLNVQGQFQMVAYLWWPIFAILF